MSQKRVASKNSTNTGQRGEAVLIKVSDTKARVKFLEDGKEYLLEVKQGKYDEDGVTVPDHVAFKKMTAGKQTRINATMTEDGKRLLYASPWSGELTVKFLGFKAEEGSQPVPETKQGKKGKPYRIFAPILEVTEGDWKGLQYRNNNLYDNFAPDEDNMLAVAGTGDSSNNLADFGDCIGVNFNSIPFSENPLPEIQEQALEADKEFQIMIVKGWIANYVSGFDIDPEEYQDVEPEPEVNEILKD